MQDVCELLSYATIGTDSHGLPIEAYVTTGTSVCGLDLRSSREMINAEMHVYDARLRLPAGTDISGMDRVRITERYGETLETALEFDLLGEPLIGPSGLVCNLRNV